MNDKLRILIVEDVPSDAKLIEYELRKADIEFKSEIVVFKNDYITAIKTFKPDLILSDYSLPRFNGEEAIEIAREISPQTPIIIVTGSVNEETAVKCMKLGAWDYVLKDRLVMLGHAVKNSLELKKDRQQIAASQRELERSEEQFRAFAENVPGVVSIYDHYPDGRSVFLYRGPGLAEIVGKKIEEEIKKDPEVFFRMIPEKDKDLLEENAKKAVESDGMLDTEYRLEVEKGKFIWIRSHFRVTPLPNNVYRWQGLIFEITKQKKIENELLENQKLLNKTQQMAHVGSWTYDLKTRKIYWSEEICQILGVDHTKVKPTLAVIMDRMHPEDLKKIRKEYISSLRKQKSYDIYHRIIRTNGDVRFMHTRTENLHDENGRPYLSIGMSQDISNIVKTQKLIRQSEQLSLAIIEESPLGISVRDRFGTLMMYNQAWKEMWHISNQRIKEFRRPRKKLQLDDRDSYLGNHLTKIEEIYRKGGNYTVADIKLADKKNRKAKWISQRFYALMDEENKVERVVILSEDITARKQAEETQKVLHNIAYAANTAKNLEELFVETRQQLGNILDTTNFFIALYDENTKMLSLPFFRDQKDDFSQFPAGRTLSGYVIETGKAQYIPRKLADEMTENDVVDRFGTPAAIWMGAPLKIKDKTIGVIVLQSYDDPELYTEKDLELLNFVSSEIASAIDKKRAEEEINIQRSYFENLFQMSPDALVILSNEDKVIQVNEEFTNLFGYSNEEAEGRYINDLIVPEELKDEGQKLTSSVSEGNTVHFESVRVDKNGNRIYVDAIGKPIILNHDQLAVQAIYRNITERKLAQERMKKDLEEKNVLLKEVHHRVKNNMQVISSMLKLQSRYITDKKALELFKNSQDRVKSMALIHERIYRSPDLASVNFDNYVRSLSRNLFINYGISGANIELQVNIDDISVNMNAAIPLGLIINELISNALKHAFPANSKGKLIINFSKDTSGQYKLEVLDNGVGCGQIELEDPKTLGMQLISALTSQLQGEMTCTSEQGTKFTLTFQ